MECQCILSERFCRPLPYTFGVYLLVWGSVWKNWFRKLRTITLQLI